VWRRQAIEVDGCTGFDGPIVVASLQLDYRRSIEFGQDVEIDVQVKGVGTKSYTLQYQAYQDGYLVLEGSTVHVHLDKETLRARKLQPEELDYLSRFIKEPLPA
jgi:acyl-CoA thioesterase FadM